MYYPHLKEVTRSLGFRLAVLYTAVFTVCALALFWAVYHLLAAAVDRQDKDVVNARLREYAGIYSATGEQGLGRWINQLQEARRQKMYFTRLTDAAGNTVLLSVPDEWDEADVQLVSSLPAPEEGAEVSWQRLYRNQETDISQAQVRLPGGSLLQVARGTGSRTELLRRFRGVFILVSVPVVLLGLLGGSLMAQKAMQPLGNLATAVRGIVATGDMSVRVPECRSRDELHDLVTLFNQMLARTETLMSAMRETVDSVAHDVRTPLTRLRFVAENALEDEQLPDSCAAPLRECLEETDRISSMIHVLMDVARAEGGVMALRPTRMDLADLAGKVAELYEHVAEEKGLELELELNAGCWTVADPARMGQALANLLDNAVKYTPSGGRIRMTSRACADTVSVMFSDTGIGISTEDMPRIWDRLYRAEKSRGERGMGLGLSLVKAIVQASGGQVAVRSTPGHGSEFTVYMSAAGPDAEPPAQEPASGTPSITKL